MSNTGKDEGGIGVGEVVTGLAGATAAAIPMYKREAKRLINGATDVASDALGVYAEGGRKGIYDAVQNILDQTPTSTGGETAPGTWRKMLTEARATIANSQTTQEAKIAAAKIEKEILGTIKENLPEGTKLWGNFTWKQHGKVAASAVAAAAVGAFVYHQLFGGEKSNSVEASRANVQPIGRTA